MKAEAPARLVSLDVFRGMTIFLMIVVNTPGAGATPFAPLLHADWHGFTLTDLVFPSFLFAVGNAIPFAARRKEDIAKQARFFKIGKRALLIFLIGYFLNWYTSMHWQNGQLTFVPFSSLRLSGVLQRIALCYLIAAVLFEVLSTRALLVLFVLVLIGYYLLLYFAGDTPDSLSLTGNIVRKVDIFILSESKMYREKGLVFDPEGILSTIPAVGNVLAGVLAGKFILERRPPFETTTMLFVSGCLLIVVAICWSWSFPFNKKLWTSSFVLLTSGINLLIVGNLMYINEIRKNKAGVYFFSVLGRNPLFIYLLSNLLLILFIIPVGNSDLYTAINFSFYQALLPGPPGSLLFALSIALVCWTAGWLLDRHKIYIRL